MREDLLTELHLPEIDVKCLQRVVTQNTARLVNLLREHDDYVKKSKINLPGYNGFSLDFAEVSQVLQKEKHPDGSELKMTAEGRQNGCLVNGISDDVEVLENGQTPSASLATDLGWGSNDEEEMEIAEVRPYPIRFHLKQDIPVSWEMDINTEGSCEAEHNIDSGTEFLGGVPEESEIEEVEVEPPVENITEESSCDPIPIITSAKGLRCYVRKKSNQKIKPTQNSETTDVIVTVDEPGENKDDDDEKPFCVIAEVVGNANAAFLGEENSSESVTEMTESQLITPKKTNDITKIKGWRRKQFFVEKPTTVEFYSYTKGPKKKLEMKKIQQQVPEPPEEPSNPENAFVCDSLDDFLDREAELKINYEIPHLYAEVGIKLTKDDIASGPNLSQEDFKKVETRYCVPLPPTDPVTVKVEEEESKKGVKRQIEDVTEACKIVKIDESRRRSIRIVQKQIDQKIVTKPLKCKKKLEKVDTNAVDVPNRAFDSVNLTTKLIGLVVYPRPLVPLHPVVQNHLWKLRTFRTKIDKNWAEFAVSAVRVKTRNRQVRRKVLPVLCCGKTEPPETEVIPEVWEVVKDLVDFVCKSVGEQTKSDDKPKKQASQGISLLKKSVKQEVELKECSVVINKIISLEASEPWCMEHNCYNCWPCRLVKSDPTPQEKKEERKEVEVIKSPKSMAVSLQTPFDDTITNLLTKKLRSVRFSGDTLTSIDSLKNLSPDGIELIRLNFVKQSFLTGYINIWYLKPETSQKRSRAFLTFCKSPPMPKAINLKSSGLNLKNLPKIIVDIVSTENTFDSNEYAILHCNGELWEIHGSLNFAMGNGKEIIEEKPEEDAEQVFTSLPLPELTKLQRIAMEFVKVKSMKWWVLDLTMKFTEIVLKTETRKAVVTRKDLLGYIKSQVYGFITLSKGKGTRVYGAYVSSKVLPYILIGPYFFLETNGLSITLNSTPVPFTYQGEENPSRDHPLKFFINSVVTGLKGSDKRLSGLWLYDKTALDNTCYLEVLTTPTSNPSKKDYIEIEHGYSLNSRGLCSTSDQTSGLVKRKDGKGSLEIVTVYLYFELFDLGYITGELQPDNSVTIKHPLAQGTKVKSHKVGDWFIRILKRRIQFIPKDLQLRWFITKHPEDLRDRQPFDKLYLGGAHILCKSGLYYMLKMTDAKIDELGLDKDEVMNAISESKVINEVAELKNLETLLSGSPNRSLAMDRVLSMAIKEIQEQEKREATLLASKNKGNRKKLKLGLRYMELLNSFGISDELKGKMFENVKEVFVTENETGDLNEDILKKLETYAYGKKYIEKLKGVEENKEVVTVEETKKEEKPEDKEKVTKKKKEKSKASDNSVIAKLEAKLANVYDMLDTNGSSQSSLEYQNLLEKLNSISDQLNSIKSIINDASKTKTESPAKTKKETQTKSKRGRKSVVLATIKQDCKNTTKEGKTEEGGFVRLNSTRLPRNIKVSSGKEVKQKRTINQTSLLKKKESVKETVSSSPLETDKGNPKIVITARGKKNTSSSSSSSNKILIIKNFKNNKTAFQRIKVSDLGYNSPKPEKEEVYEEKVEAWDVKEAWCDEKKEADEGSEGKQTVSQIENSLKMDESDIR